jgi:seryl-tRNA synthetase
MLDIKYIRTNSDIVQKAANDKNIAINLDRILELDTQILELKKQQEDLQSQRNQHSKATGNSQSSENIALGKKIKEELIKVEALMQPMIEELNLLIDSVPNIPIETVPIGKTEDDNLIIEVLGNKPNFDFTPKNHEQIAITNNWLDKERAAKISGSRFAFLKGGIVRLQFALVNYLMDRLQDEEWLRMVIEKNNLNVSPKAFCPIVPPMMIKTEPYKKSGRLDGENVTYKLENDDLWLNGSAEHPLCSMYMDETLKEEDLPIRYIGYATSFRREAGTYGKDMEGIFRMHQFDKLEMESFSTQESGEEEHEFLISIQKEIYLELGLHIQVINKCTADIGIPNASGWDINAWLPGQDKFREVSSADYMTDFQARGLNTRYKTKDGKTNFVHTNDATGIVLSRIPIAIIETYQTVDQKVRVPEILKRYLNRAEYL